MELDKTIKERHSVRSFKETKKPSWEEVVKAIDAANYAPLAGNISTIRFIVVQDKEKLKQIAKACQQSFVASTGFIVVVCSDLTQLKRSYEDTAQKFSRQQAGAAIQNFLLEITNLGLGSCWVGAFSEQQVKQILTIPDDIEVEAILPVGFEFEKKPKQRKRPDLDNVLYFDKWKNKFMLPQYKKE